MSEPLLTMTGMGISFSGVPALVDAHLTIGRGEVHALIGQNGAGKSTMIKILTGAYKRDEGTIKFAGKEIDFSSPQDPQPRTTAPRFSSPDFSSPDFGSPEFGGPDHAPD